MGESGNFQPDNNEVLTTMKRQRGRGRGKPGGNQGNRSFESNGPDVKIRGNAATIHEKYMQLARDASSSGDRVMAENYYQHADHFFRVVAEQQAALIEQQQRRERQQSQHNGQNNADGGNNDRRRNYNNRNRNGADDSSGDQPTTETKPQGETGSDQPEAETPRRGRRPRRQPVESKRDPLEVVDPEAGEKTEIAKSGDDDEQPKPRRGRRPRKSAEAENGDDKSGDGSETEAA
jgi:hypothetical protein